MVPAACLCASGIEESVKISNMSPKISVDNIGPFKKCMKRKKSVISAHTKKRCTYVKSTLHTRRVPLFSVLIS
jgi:hypothetical protein